MNAHDTTESFDRAIFPIPFHMTGAFDDLDDAISMLRVVYELLSDHVMISEDFTAHLSVVLSGALEKLEPVSIYLAKEEGREKFSRYSQARREWICKKAGIGANRDG